MKFLFLMSGGRIGIVFTALFTNLLFVFPASSQQIDTASYYRITNVSQGEGKSITLSGGGTEHQHLLLRTTAESPLQYWKFVREINGNYRIVNPNVPGKSIEVVNDGVNNKLGIAVNSNSAGQFWRITKHRETAGYRFHSLWLGGEKSLGVVNDERNYKELTMSESAQVDDQLWNLTKIQMIQPNPTPDAAVAKSIIDPASVYRITCLWQGDSKSIGVEKNIPLLEATASDSSQCWKLVHEANGFYRFINQQFTDKSLDVINDGAQNNKLTLSATNNYSGQFWKLTPNPDGTFRITTMWQGDAKSLDVLNDGVNNNALLLNNTGSYSGQFWKLTKTSLPSKAVAVLPPPLIAPVQPTATTKSKLSGDEELLPEMKLVSPNGNYRLVQQQDGNLVIYNSNDKPTWASQTYGKNVKACVMQKDGNLVLYLPYHVPVWASNTNGNEGAYLAMQDDGNLVIYGKDGQSLWATNTNEK